MLQDFKIVFDRLTGWCPMPESIEALKRRKREHLENLQNLHGIEHQSKLDTVSYSYDTPIAIFSLSILTLSCATTFFSLFKNDQPVLSGTAWTMMTSFFFLVEDILSGDIFSLFKSEFFCLAAIFLENIAAYYLQSLSEWSSVTCVWVVAALLVFSSNMLVQNRKKAALAIVENTKKPFVPLEALEDVGTQREKSPAKNVFKVTNNEKPEVSRNIFVSATILSFFSLVGIPESIPTGIIVSIFMAYVYFAENFYSIVRCFFTNLFIATVAKELQVSTDADFATCVCITGTVTSCLNGLIFVLRFGRNGNTPSLAMQWKERIREERAKLREIERLIMRYPMQDEIRQAEVTHIVSNVLATQEEVTTAVTVTAPLPPAVVAPEPLVAPALLLASVATTVSDQNHVVIRIWQTRVEGEPASTFAFARALLLKKKKPMDAIGHASLHVIWRGEHRYVSFWPKEDGCPNLHQPGIFLDSKKEDEEREKRLADYCFFLFSLDIEMLWTLADKESLRSRYPTWSAAADIIVTNPIARVLGTKSPSQSCSGVVYELLQQAGISRLNIPFELVRDGIITHPNNLREFFLRAQTDEHAKWPCTMEYPKIISDRWADALIAADSLEEHQEIHQHVSDLVLRYCAPQKSERALTYVPSVPKETLAVSRLKRQESEEAALKYFCNAMFFGYFCGASFAALSITLFSLLDTRYPVFYGAILALPVSFFSVRCVGGAGQVCRAREENGEFIYGFSSKCKDIAGIYFTGVVLTTLASKIFSFGNGMDVSKPAILFALISTIMVRFIMTKITMSGEPYVPFLR